MRPQLPFAPGNNRGLRVVSTRRVGTILMIIHNRRNRNSGTWPIKDRPH